MEDDQHKSSEDASSKLFSLPVVGRGLIAVAGIVLGIGVPAAAGFYIGHVVGHDRWIEFLLVHFNVVVGIPFAAAASFGVVVVFFTSIKGSLNFKVLGLEMTGPSGPILFWVVCFMVFVLAISVLSAPASTGAQAPE